MDDVPQGSVSKIPGGLEPKLAIFSNQAKLQVEELGHKIFDLQLVLIAEYSRTGASQNPHQRD